MTEAKTRVAFYVRISRDPEGTKFGVTRQLEDLHALAERNGWALIRIYSDNDRSASSLAKKPREQFELMLKDARAGDFDVIAAYSSSRLTRRIREFETLIDLAQGFNTRFAFIKSPVFDLNTADGRLIARILANVDAAEAEKVAERSKRQIEQRRNSGKVPAAQRCFGYADTTVIEPDGTTKTVHSYLHPDPVEGPMIKHVFEMVALGKGAPEAEKYLAAHSSERFWNAASVHNILARPTYAGLTRDASGNLIKATNVEAIVTPAIWHAAQATLNERRQPDRAPMANYLLSGVVMCGECGARMVASKGSGGRRAQTPYWQCRRRPGINACQRVARSMNIIDAKVHAFVVARINQGRVSAPAATLDPAVQKEITDLNTRMSTARALMASGGLDMEDGAALLKNLRGQLNTLQRASEAALTAQTRAVREAETDTMTVWLDESPEALTVRQIILRRYVSAVLVSRVVIPPGGTRRQASQDAVQVIPA